MITKNIQKGSLVRDRKGRLWEFSHWSANENPGNRYTYYQAVCRPIGITHVYQPFFPDALEAVPPFDPIVEDTSRTLWDHLIDKQ